MNPRSASFPMWNSVLLPKSSAEFGVYCGTAVKINVRHSGVCEMPGRTNLHRTYITSRSSKTVLPSVKSGSAVEPNGASSVFPTPSPQVFPTGADCVAPQHLSNESPDIPSDNARRGGTTLQESHFPAQSCCPLSIVLHAGTLHAASLTRHVIS